MAPNKIENLKNDIKQCDICKEALSAGPRPIVQFSAKSKILIIGQAPGSRVHESGIAWDDNSGDRIRQWMNVDKHIFYDEDKIALIPMGFCYPGKGKGGDLPPRRECAPAWHDQIMRHLPADKLILLVGSYAQIYYMPQDKKLSMTQRVRNFGINNFEDDKGVNINKGGNNNGDNNKVIALPHPSWRSTNWMRQNPWFEDEILPKLRLAIKQQLCQS
ncbi:IclR family transcriptional regulator [Sphingorhabdus lutea]|uniref:IclR family transcriptional regulator n=1 Tax=Sphingorhabdus lutea TaxID=1913578 RepID=A0A1L3JF93_9SPHN|nr:uracil-DNA glycosylase family protein [Sphingorhabdus lutea]APG63807.1 IclR family transcriptional regulator [Sphingorhabdus lutea]